MTSTTDHVPVRTTADRRGRAFYWIATGTFAALFLGSFVLTVTDPEESRRVTVFLDYPAWTVYPLAFAKLAGVVTMRCNRRAPCHGAPPAGAPAGRRPQRAGDADRPGGADRAIDCAGPEQRGGLCGSRISRATVKTHVSNILLKLGFTSRLQIAVWAYEHGIVRVNPRR